MNSTKNICNLCLKRQKQLLLRSTEKLSQIRLLFGFGKKKETKPAVKEVVMTPELEDQMERQLTEEDIMKMRDKSRLPALVRSQLTGQNILPIRYLWQMETQIVKSRYGIYGRASGLKPGVQWPHKEELQWLKGYEKAFCKPFDVLVNEMKERKATEAKVRSDRQKDVLSKLKDLPKIKAEFWAKYNKMHDDLNEERLKKERLVQEVREFVGYDLDPNDPRFEEALIRRDEEKKKLLKSQKKAQKQKETLEKLQALATEAMEREREEQDIIEKSKTKTKPEAKAKIEPKSEEIKE